MLLDNFSIAFAACGVSALVWVVLNLSLAKSEKAEKQRLAKISRAWSRQLWLADAVFVSMVVVFVIASYSVAPGELDIRQAIVGISLCALLFLPVLHLATRNLDYSLAEKLEIYAAFHGWPPRVMIYTLAICAASLVIVSVYQITDMR